MRLLSPIGIATTQWLTRPETALMYDTLRGGGLEEERCADAALLASRRRFFAAGSLARDCDLSTDVSMASA